MDSSPSPYRTSDPPIVIDPPTFWERIKMWQTDMSIGASNWWGESRDGFMTTMSWIVATLCIAGVSCAIALLMQWVVTGLAGHPIGEFRHYIGAVWLYAILNYHSRSSDDK